MAPSSPGEPDPRLLAYDYDLPEHAIARHPAHDREDARLLIVGSDRRDGRVRDRDFFSTPRSEAHRNLADSNTPKVARQWGFRMNLDRGSFESMFRKFDGTRG